MLVAAAFIATVTCLSFDGFEPMGLSLANLSRSLWVVAVALLVAAAAVFVAGSLHTLRLPETPIQFIESYGVYAIWAFLQQFLLQSIFLSRLLRLGMSTKWAVLLTAVIFASAHLPSPILTAITFVCGVASSLVFLRYRNLYPLAIAHAILGISIGVTVPGPMVHNMRVGLGYLTYAKLQNVIPLLQRIEMCPECASAMKPQCNWVYRVVHGGRNEYGLQNRQRGGLPGQATRSG